MFIFFLKKMMNIKDFRTIKWIYYGIKINLNLRKIFVLYK